MSWKEFHEEEKSKEYFDKLEKKVEHLYSDEYKFFTEVYPPKELIYRCFEETPINNVKIVIIGQDPYHQKDQANGLAFAVNEGVSIPPSLRNIVKESGCTDTTLIKWAKQGVLLLNAYLTVKDSKPMSCNNIGWETYTDNAIHYLLENTQYPLIFCLWGNFARSKKKIICEYDDIIVLESTHPSPLSANNPSQPFIGCGHFVKINKILEERGEEVIEW